VTLYGRYPAQPPEEQLNRSICRRLLHTPPVCLTMSLSATSEMADDLPRENGDLSAMADRAFRSDGE